MHRNVYVARMEDVSNRQENQNTGMFVDLHEFHFICLIKLQKLRVKRKSNKKSRQRIKIVNYNNAVWNV